MEDEQEPKLAVCRAVWHAGVVTVKSCFTFLLSFTPPPGAAYIALWEAASLNPCHALRRPSSRRRRCQSSDTVAFAKQVSSVSPSPACARPILAARKVPWLGYHPQRSHTMRRSVNLASRDAT